MNKIRFITILICNLILCSNCLLAEAKKTIKIGFIAPLSGAAASYGIGARNGFNLALKEIGTERFEVIYEDDQYSAAKAVAAFKKLTSIDKVDLIIGMASTPSNAVAPLAEKAQIPFIAWANDPKVAKDRNFVIISDISALDQGRIIAREAIARSYNNFALIYAVGDYQTAILNGVKSEIANNLILLEEEIPQDSSDFRSVLTKAKNKAVQSMMLCLHPGQSGLLAKQARQLGLNLNYFGCDVMQDSNENKIAEGALSQAWYISSTISPEFTALYKSTFGEEGIAIAAANGHEVARVLAKAWDKEANTANIIKNMLSVQIESGPLGRFEVIRKDGIQFFNLKSQFGSYAQQ